MVEDHQQEEGDSQHVGKDCKLDVTDHGEGWVFCLKYKTFIKIEILVKCQNNLYKIDKKYKFNYLEPQIHRI